MLRKSIFLETFGKFFHALETQSAPIFLEWLYWHYSDFENAIFLLDSLFDCFWFPSPLILPVPQFFLLFLWWCCWISDMVCSSWDPPSAAAQRGWAAWDFWLHLLDVASKWIQIFLAFSLPTSSKLCFPFDTCLWLPFHTPTSPPLTGVIFQDRDSVSHKNAGKDRGHTGHTADRNSSKSHADGFPSIAKATQAGLQAHDSATLTD